MPLSIPRVEERLGMRVGDSMADRVAVWKMETAGDGHDAPGGVGTGHRVGGVRNWRRYCDNHEIGCASTNKFGGGAWNIPCILHDATCSTLSHI